jgi:hypothetical protein
MNRYCFRHSHRGSSRAYRAILARHSLDRVAQQQLADEHGDCVDCWRDTALAAVDAAASMLVRCWPLPEQDASGLVSGESIDWLLGIIDDLLGCEAADRRDLSTAQKAR